MVQPMPKLGTLLWRGWRKKCPQCGQGGLYKRWMRLHDYCPVCGLKYLQSQGDLFGPLVLVDRVLFIIPLIVLFYFGVWHPGLAGLLLVGVTAIFLLIYTMPHRNGVSLAIDYFIRRKEGDLADDRSR
jgi:uncharacterized protein (DUF983 family)